MSQLARDLAMNRTLLHFHLQKLEAAGLVSRTLELSDDGKAMRYITVEPFALVQTPEAIAKVVQSIDEQK